MAGNTDEKTKEDDAVKNVVLTKDVILTRSDLASRMCDTPNAELVIENFSLSHKALCQAERVVFVDGDFVAVLKDRNGTIEQRAKVTAEVTEENEESALAQLQDVLVPAVSQSEFNDKITPKKPGDEPDQAKRLNFFKCAKCKSIHMRHAGYMELVLPYVLGGEGAKVSRESLHVMICVKCKNAYVWYNGQMYDVTDQVDMKAWETTEVECQKAVGPGGDC